MKSIRFIYPFGQLQTKWYVRERVSYVELHDPPFKHVIPDVQVERYWQFGPV
jgi:hypothetical protein